jgi:predicted MPP superfamily phosphohydrolase
MKFFSLLFSVVVGSNFFIFFRLWHLVPAGNLLRPLLIVLGCLLTSTLFIGFRFEDTLPVSLASFFYKLGTSWFIISIYALMLFLVLDLLRLTPLPMHRILHQNWTSFLIIIVGMTALMTYGYFNYKHKVRVELPIRTEKPMEPLKIVALSDLHLGYNIGKTELEEWIALINKEKPDIVLLAGDMIDNALRPLAEQDIATVFRTIKSRYGVFACPGNHEHIGSRMGRSDEMNQTLAFFKTANINLLRDTTVLVDNRFYVVGREDYSASNRLPLANILQHIDRTKPVILLDHQPRHLAEAAENGIDLQISGHTHSGQVFPANLLVKKLFEIPQGYKQKDNTHIYVSSGIGIWGGKFRIGTQSEYVVITMN